MSLPEDLRAYVQDTQLVGGGADKSLLAPPQGFRPLERTTVNLTLQDKKGQITILRRSPDGMAGQEFPFNSPATPIDTSNRPQSIRRRNKITDAHQTLSLMPVTKILTPNLPNPPRLAPGYHSRDPNDNKGP